MDQALLDVIRQMPVVVVLLVIWQQQNTAHREAVAYYRARLAVIEDKLLSWSGGRGGD